MKAKSRGDDHCGTKQKMSSPEKGTWWSFQKEKSYEEKGYFRNIMKLENTGLVTTLATKHSDAEEQVLKSEIGQMMTIVGSFLSPANTCFTTSPSGQKRENAKAQPTLTE